MRTHFQPDGGGVLIIPNPQLGTMLPNAGRTHYDTTIYTDDGGFAQSDLDGYHSVARGCHLLRDTRSPIQIRFLNWVR